MTGTVRKAKDILGASDAEWQKLAPRIGVTDPKALAIYRERYREGIPRRPVAEEERDRVLAVALLRTGGPEVAGVVRRAGRFWKVRAKSSMIKASMAPA